MIALPTHLTAAQFDAPYYDLQEKNKDKWAAEDKQINAKSDKPFFIYWATYTQQLQGSKAHHNDKHVDKTNAQASEMAAHNAHIKQMLDTLESEGIAENTLDVRISDNGPMYAFYPNSGYSFRSPCGNI